MEKVINLGIPHVGEHVFECIDTPGLINCLLVSKSWKELAENVLVKRWKGRLFEACEDGATTIVRLLLNRCKFEESGLNNEYLAYSDRTMNLNARYGNGQCGYTALMVACYEGHKDIVELLLNYSKRSIDLNAKDDNGATAFSIACHSGHIGIVQLFLNHSHQSINLNEKDDAGFTGLMWACFRGHKDAVELLLDNSNIELNARNNYGKTAFMLACVQGLEVIVHSFIRHFDRKNTELDINTKDDSQMNAFMLACYNGRIEIVKLLFNRFGIKLRLNARDYMRRNAFRLACVEGHKDVVQFLLNGSDQNIDFNAKDNYTLYGQNGYTGFWWACFKGHKDVVQLLLEHSTDVDITIAEGSDCAFSNEIKDLLASKNNLNHNYNLRRIKRPKQK